MPLRKKNNRRERLSPPKGAKVQRGGGDRSAGTRSEVLTPGDFTPIPRDEIEPGYKSTRLKFVLVKPNPNGRPYMIAHTAWLCFMWWCKEQNILLLNDETEDAAMKKFRKSGWTIHNAEIIAIVGTEVKEKDIEDSEL